MNHGDENQLDKNPESADAGFSAALQQLLHDAEPPLDYVSASRLASARARAVEAAAKRRAPRWWWALPTSVAAGALLAVVLLRAPAQLPLQLSGPRAFAQTDALELLGEDGEALAMYEDLDFYQWLSDTDGAI